MRKKLMSLILTACMTLSLSPAVFAATQEELDQPEVFIKQEGRGTCTLAATTMMLRRTAMLRGDEDWNGITQATCQASFWLGGRGLPYTFEYDGITVGHERLPGGTANRQVLIDLLAEHPEGIVLHARCVPHGILLTDYTDGVFYCADSAQHIPEGRIPIEEAYGTRVENSSACWYVTSPVASVEPETPQLTLPSQETTPTTLASLTAQEDEPALPRTSCLMGQGLARQG